MRMLKIGNTWINLANVRYIVDHPEAGEITVVFMDGEGSYEVRDTDRQRLVGYLNWHGEKLNDALNFNLSCYALP